MSPRIPTTALPRTWRPALALLVGLILMLAHAASAHAGAYNVKSCWRDHADPGGVPEGWSFGSDPTMASYQACQVGYGIVTRNVVGSGQANYQDMAWSDYNVPAPNTTIAHVRAEGSAFGGANGNDYRAGWLHNAPAGAGWGGYCDVKPYTSTGTGAGCGWAPDEGTFWGVGQLYAAGPFDVDVPAGATRFELRTRCIKTGTATCYRNAINAQAKLTNITFTLSNNTAPTLSNGRGGLWTNSGWMEGTQSAAFDASDDVGVKGSFVDIDGVNRGAAWASCDEFRVVQCNGGGAGATINTSDLPDGDHTVRMYAMDSAGNWADAGTRVFHVDHSNPAAPSKPVAREGDGWLTVYNETAATPTNQRTGTFHLDFATPPVSGSPNSSTDVELCPVDVDGNTTGACVQTNRNNADGTETATVLPGRYRARVRVRDALHYGTWSDSSKILQFDPITPKDPTQTRINGWINKDEHPDFQVTARPKTSYDGGQPPVSGIAGFSVTTDGTTPDETKDLDAQKDPDPSQPEFAPVNIDTLPDGVNVIKSRAISGAGLATPSSTVDTSVVAIDRRVPEVGTSGQTDWAWTNADSVTVDVTGTDQSDLSGITGAPLNQPYTNGGYLTYDINGGAEQHIRGDQPAGSDPVSGLPTGVESKSVPVTITQEGANDLTVKATDLAGNDSASKTVKVNIDRTKPAIDAAGDTGWAWSNADTVTVKATGTDQSELSGMAGALGGQDITDGGYLTAQVDGDPATETRGPQSPSHDNIEQATADVPVSAEGAHTVTMQATDAAGNHSADRSVRVNIDRTNPTVDALGGTGSSWTRDDSVSVTITGTDQADLSGMAGDQNALTDGGHLSYEIDGEDQQDVPGPASPDHTNVQSADTTVKITDEGAHLVSMQATDLAGNKSERRFVRVNIDRTAPKLALEGVAVDGAQPINAPVTIKAVASDELSGMDGVAPVDSSAVRAASATSDGGYVEYQLDGGETRKQYGDTAEIDVPNDGSHTVRVRAVDVAGNASTWRTSSFTVDQKPPSGGVEPRDPNNPRLISFYVDEACIKSATIEVRPQDKPDWQTLPTTIGDHHVTAQLTDELMAYPGGLAVRATVTDCAGNTSIIDNPWDPAANGGKGGPGTGPAVLEPVKRTTRILRAAWVKTALKACAKPAKKSKKATKRKAKEKKAAAAKRKAKTKKVKPGTCDQEAREEEAEEPSEGPRRRGNPCG